MENDNPNKLNVASAPSDNDSSTVELGAAGVKSKSTNSPDASPKGITNGSSKKVILISLGVVFLVGVVLAIVLPLTLKDDNDKNTNAVLMKATIVGPLNTTLPLLNSAVLKTYTTEDEFKDDLNQAFRFVVSSTILRNNGPDYISPTSGTSGGVADGGTAASPTVESSASDSKGTADAAFASGASTNAAASTTSGVSDSVSDYGTNNQEKGVEEGDVIVSDGTYVYAAYGDYIVIWNAETGTSVAKIQMPSIDAMNKTIHGDRRNLQEKIAIDTMPYPYFNPKPSIAHLLLQGTRLVVSVSGYGFLHYDNLPSGRDYPIVSSFLGTHIRLYDTSSLSDSTPTLKLIGTKDVNGDFMAARAIDGNAHIVTASYLDIYSTVAMPFERFNFNDTFTADEYTSEVVQQAPATIEEIVNQVTAELKAGGALPNITRLSYWQSQLSNNTELERTVYFTGFANSVALTHSFDLTANSLDTSVFSSSATFVPASYVQVYSSVDTLILASSIYTYDPVTFASSDSMALLSLKLDGATATAHSVGTVDGYIMNPYSFDVQEGVLRVATTINNWWMETADGPVSESRTENYVITLSLPDPSGDEPGQMKQLGKLKLGEPNEVFTAVRFFDNVAYAVTFEQTDPLYVLDLSNPSSPKILGELKVSGFSSYLHSINDDNSLILAIGNEADVNGTITGMKLTIFDTSNPASPKVAKSLVVANEPNSYSYSDSQWDFKATRYAAGRLIIPLDIYNYNDPTKSFNGFKVYVADASNLVEECSIAHEPLDSGAIIAYETVPIDSNVTTAGNDTIVTTEASGSSTGSSSGSAGTSDSANATDPSGTSTIGYCFYCTTLPRRSMIFDGNLMTTAGQGIISTDLGTCKKVWEQEIVIKDDAGSCCGYMY